MSERTAVPAAAAASDPIARMPLPPASQPVNRAVNRPATLIHDPVEILVLKQPPRTRQTPAQPVNPARCSAILWVAVAADADMGMNQAFSDRGTCAHKP